VAQSATGVQGVVGSNPAAPTDMPSSTCGFQSKKLQKKESSKSML
jgi:hypothetical protein